MDTLRVNICYRPLRIGWVIQEGDIQGFRQAVKINHALWGGRFNPILVADLEENSRELVNLYRVDMLLPVGESTKVKAFVEAFPHLIKPFYGDIIYKGGEHERAHANVLDIHNALVFLRDMPARKAMKEKGFRIYNWSPDDPLADVFLAQLGSYPSADEIGIDYKAIVSSWLEAEECSLSPDAPISQDVIEHPGISYLSRYALARHYSVRARPDSPGFFIGDATDIEDLRCFWNLRAADIALWFIDPAHIGRYGEIIPVWGREMRESVAHQHEWDRHVALWARGEPSQEVLQHFSDMQLVTRSLIQNIKNGFNVEPPMMSWEQVSALGVINIVHGKPKIAFSLNEKPFSDKVFFHSQNLVASVSFIGGLYEDDQHTLAPPYVPELNEFYAREIVFEYNKLRIEPERIGIVVYASKSDIDMYALSVAKLIDKVFGLAGYSTELSNGGLITRQIVRLMGGLQGCRVFKIPGVRRLLKKFGPTASFTRKTAVSLIVHHQDRDASKFSDHHDLYIEPREVGSRLKPDDVFDHLVEHGMFRIGVDVRCPSCRMKSWISLDTLRQTVVCDLCGNEHDATRQITKKNWDFRRSGIFGAELNSQGAIPVALTLQQLDTTLHSTFMKMVYSTSLNLTKSGQKRNECEIDFVWIVPRTYPDKTAIILGECKDQGPIGEEEFRKDIETLRRISDALPQERFKTFSLLAKMAPFTDTEVKLAESLNVDYRQRVILLTPRELEPYQIYEWTKKEHDIKDYGSTPEDLANNTAMIYFKPAVGRAVEESEPPAAP